MIDPNEVMIGNYVYPDNNHGEHVQVCAQDFESTEYLDPIPLDEAWLLKLGFEKHEFEPYHFIGMQEYEFQVSINGFSGTLEKDPNWFCTIVGYSHKTTFTKMYVHEIQNLFLAITGDKLEIKE